MNKVLSKEEILYWGKNIEELWNEEYQERYYYPNTKIFYSGYIYEKEGDRILYYGMLNEGIENGEFVYFHENGNISAIRCYEDGVFEGYYALYSESGSILEDGMYHLGYQVYYNKYDKNGEFVVQVPYSYKRINAFGISCGIEKKIQSIIERKESDLCREQQRLENLLSFENQLSINDVHTVAGVDFVYWNKDGQEYAICSIVVVDYDTHEIIEKVSSKGIVKFSYNAEYLAFRDVPLFMKAENMLKTYPDIYLFKRNEYLYPRHMGTAALAEIVLQKPTIGISDNACEIKNEEHEMPVFLSIGNMIDLNTATEIVKKMTTKGSDIPMPINLANREANITKEL